MDIEEVGSLQVVRSELQARLAIYKSPGDDIRTFPKCTSSNTT
jgi:hypothetical protein